MTRDFTDSAANALDNPARPSAPSSQNNDQFPAFQRLIGRHSAPALLVRPESGLVLYANDAAVTFYGYEPARLMGMTIEDLSTGPVEEVRAIRQRAVAGEGHSLEVHHRLANGEERILLAHSSPISIDGETLLLAILLDVTPLHVVRDALSVRQQELDMVVAASNSGVLNLDLRTGVITASDAVWDLLGLSLDCSMTTKEFSNLLHPDDAKAVIEHNLRAIDRRERFERRFRLRRSDGNYTWVLGTAKAIYDETGKAFRYIGSIRDISFTKRIEADLRASEGRYRKMFEASPVPMLVVDETGENVLEVNDAALSLYRCDRQDLAQRPLASVLDVDYEDATKMLLSCEGGSASIAMRHRDLAGSILEVECRSCLIKSFDRAAILLMVQDLTKSKADASEIVRLATRDRLTALPNRNFLADRINDAISVSRPADSISALLLINLDSFKAINETLGREGADQVLVEVGNRLGAMLNPGDLLARIDGDEFAILVRDVDNNTANVAGWIEQFAQSCLEKLRLPMHLNDFDLALTGSIGIAMFTHEARSAEEVLRCGQSALNQARLYGRDCLRYFDPEIQRALDSRASLEIDLRRAVNESQFELYYQLQVDQQAKPVGAEVLLRWNHPERGLVPPFQFIELAEETGIIVPLGQWVLDQACSRLADWADKTQYQDLRLSVNVSARQFRQPGFVNDVTGALVRSGANPSLLTLELTESMLLDYSEEAIGKMEELRALGVGFSLDDFGTGYSSLAYLKKLPLDELKIDRGFIRDILTDPSDAVIVRTIIGMATNLGLSLIAEGVESEGQHRCLTQWGCTGFQGYFFGRPVPYESFTVVSASLESTGSVDE